jgi:hypothetical protein
LDPDQLRSAATLRAQLFAWLIPALVSGQSAGAASTRPFWRRRPYDPAKMVHWLGFLADHLSGIRVGRGRVGTRDFIWWRVARHTVRPAALAASFGLVTWLATGIGLAVGLGPTGGFLVGAGLGFAFGIGLPTRYRDLFRPWSWSEEGPGSIAIRPAGRVPAFTRTVGLYTLAGGLPVGALAGLATGRPMAAVPAGVWGALIGLLTGLVAWAVTPAPMARPNTPMSNWRADRTLNLLRCAAGGLGAMVVVGVIVEFGGTWGRRDQVVIEYGPAYFAAALGIGLMVGLGFGAHHAWPAYLVATYRLALPARLPRRLMPFLDDAHRLGLLRAVGPIYQFRHAELHDRLAEAYRRRSAEPW